MSTSASPSPRILFILDYFHPHLGGVETLFGALAAALVRKGHRVTVLTTKTPGASARGILEGVEIVRVATPRFAARYCFAFLGLARALALARRADLVHTTTYTAAFPAWLASRLWRVPAVITVHEVLGPQWNALPGLSALGACIARLLERIILRLPFQHVVCDCGFSRDRLLSATSLEPARVSVCYPAVDYDFWDPRRFRARPLKRELRLSDNTFLFLFFGRPGVTKGVEFLLEAVRELTAHERQFHLLLLLGPDPPSQYRRVLRALERLALEPWISTRPPVPRDALPSYLLAADCIVVPSLSEGFGYSAVEAASLGCPVIATKGNSLEEVVGDYATLCAPGDSTALAAAMKTAMTRGTRPLAPLPRRFTLARHLDCVLGVYRSLLGRDV